MYIRAALKLRKETHKVIGTASTINARIGGVADEVAVGVVFAGLAAHLIMVVGIVTSNDNTFIGALRSYFWGGNIS